MDPLLAGFSDELTKLSSSLSVDREELDRIYRELKKKTKPPRSALRRFGRKAKKTGVDYATPASIGAVITPLMGIAMTKGKRVLHNREVRRMMKRTLNPESRRALKAHLYTGKTLSRSNIGKGEYGRAVTTPRDLAFDAARGAGAGALVQWLRRQMKKDD